MCLLHEQRWEAGHQCFRSKPARTGPCFKAPDSRATFLIFRRNLVRRLRAIAPSVRFVGKPGRTLSGLQPQVRAIAAWSLRHATNLLGRTNWSGATDLAH